MFTNCENIIKIDFICFNTKNINSMKYMFHKCKNLLCINNILLFDTRNITDISNMFSHCYNLDNIDLSSFNIKNIKNINHLFDYCYNLKNLKLFYFDHKIKNDLLYIYNKLKIVPYNIKNNIYFDIYLNEIDILIKIEKDDINKKIYFLDNFVDYNSDGEVKELNICFTELNNKNTKLYINDIKIEYKRYFIPKKDGYYNIKLKFKINLTNSSYMFAKCTNIIQINFICFNTSFIRNMSFMFLGCCNLNHLNLSSFDISNVTNMSYMFSGCSNLKNLYLISFDTKNVNDMSHMFYECSNLTNLDLSSFNTNNVNNMSSMFFNCRN